MPRRRPPATALPGPPPERGPVARPPAPRPVQRPKACAQAWRQARVRAATAVQALGRWAGAKAAARRQHAAPARAPSSALVQVPERVLARGRSRERFAVAQAQAQVEAAQALARPREQRSRPWAAGQQRPVTRPLAWLSPRLRRLRPSRQAERGWVCPRCQPVARAATAAGPALRPPPATEPAQATEQGPAQRREWARAPRRAERSARVAERCWRAWAVQPRPRCRRLCGGSCWPRGSPASGWRPGAARGPWPTAQQQPMRARLKARARAPVLAPARASWSARRPGRPDRPERPEPTKA